MTEKHLLFAVLAFESDLIDLAQLTAVCRAWAADKSKPIADLLVERGWITAEDRGFVEKQLARKLAKHQHDPRVTLNSVVRGDVCDAIKQVEDADIQQSLSSWPSSGPVLIETIGETLGEPEQPKSRYTWVSEVGKGGLGKVWLARDNDLAREVALKEVKPGSASTEAVRRLIKEAQITGQLQHPNIVPVYEVNRGGRPFYTMKLVKGETLSKAIRRHHEQLRAGREDPLSLPRLLNVFVNVCEALAYAHSRGIIHRDLKPENIVLGDYGEAIVLDWGLAKQIGSADEETAPVVLTDDAQSPATRLGATPGTPAYMSPEQAAGRVDLLDHRTDIYGLGTILFEILTGHPPHRTPTNQASGAASAPRSEFDHAPGNDSAKDRGADAAPLAKIATIHDLLQRISESPTPRARDLDATISRELDAICATAMAKKRDERYLDAKALAADVKRSLAHQPVSVYRTTPWERLRLWRRRNPTVAALSLFLAVSLLTGSVVSTLFGLAANREAGRANTAAKRADAKAAEARANSYIANIRLAAFECESGRIENMATALEAARPKPYEPDIRGWEWNYLWNPSRSELLVLKGHTGNVNSVAFSADGKRLASASDDQTVKLWDVASGQVTLSLKGHIGLVTSVAFSPDGKRLASASEDQTVKVWDATSGQETIELKGHAGQVMSVAFSSDGKRLVSSSSDRTVKVWDATSGQEMLTLRMSSSPVVSVAFSPDGKRLASASSYTNSGPFSNGGVYSRVNIWDSTSGQETVEFLSINSGGVMCVAFSPDGKWLASAFSDGTVTVCESTSGHETLLLKGHTDAVTNVAFSADGKRLVSASIDRTVKVWDATNGQETITLKGHSSPVRSVAFSPDGKWLASASSDATVILWDGRPETEDKARTIEREARTTVSLFHLKTASKDELVAAIENDETISDSVRDLASKMAKTVKVWDADPWTPELLAEREALSALRFLCSQPIGKDTLIQQIRDDQTISDAVRQQALELAETYWQRKERQWVGELVYLTAERKQLNLLRNGSFENQVDNSVWTATSWRKNSRAVAIQEGVVHDGNRSVLLATDVADDVNFAQEVAVQPNTDYLLCGWVKTEGVQLVERVREIGATLSVLGGYEHSQSVTDDRDWTYLALKFNSGQRNKVQVCARLGHISSTCIGKAWFDDLCLIPLDDPPPIVSR